MLTSLSIKPGMAWCFVFLPALCYYIGTRLQSLGLFRSSSYGRIVDHVTLHRPTTGIADPSWCSNTLSKLLYTNKDCSALSRPMFMVQDEGLDQIVATTWKHDDELGRGYLLVSTSGGAGRVWQWETGGGPIPIGRTLHLDQSGCRSNRLVNCSDSSAMSLYGSGGIVVDPFVEPPRLIVSEWGEGRISRLEDNGARTPLIIQYNENENMDPQRDVHRPTQLLMTPFGDLVVLDAISSDDSDSPSHFLWMLSQTTTIPSLPSLLVSRQAHEWISVNRTTTGLPKVLLESTTGQLGGTTLVPKQWSDLYVTMQQNDSIVVVQLSLDEKDNDEDEETRSGPPQSKNVLDYSSYTREPGPIEVDSEGLLYLIVDSGFIIANPILGTVLTKVTVPDTQFVDLTIGEDHFLYLTTKEKLYRMRIRNGPVKVPTNLVISH